MELERHNPGHVFCTLTLMEICKISHNVYVRSSPLMAAVSLPWTLDSHRRPLRSRVLFKFSVVLPICLISLRSSRHPPAVMKFYHAGGALLDMRQTGAPPRSRGHYSAFQLLPLSQTSSCSYAYTHNRDPSFQCQSFIDVCSNRRSDSRCPPLSYRSSLVPMSDEHEALCLIEGMIYLYK